MSYDEELAKVERENAALRSRIEELEGALRRTNERLLDVRAALINGYTQSIGAELNDIRDEIARAVLREGKEE